MLVLLRPGSSQADADRIVAKAAQAMYHAQAIVAGDRFAVAITGGARPPGLELFRDLPGVDRVERQAAPFVLASRLLQPADTVVDVAGVAIGGQRIVVIAGPCAVESEAQLFATAERAQKNGVQLLRAGAFKLRTSPWSFQGLGGRGLELLAEVRRSTGLRIVTEVVSESTLAATAAVADLLQVGARNMKSYELLKRVGEAGRPVLLKRAGDATLDELLASAEHLLAAGAPGVILCERGVRGFGDHARNTLDLAAVPALRLRTHLPIVVDPSHGTGQRELVGPMARAAIAAGADGVLVEIHPMPEAALSDGPQALRFEDFDRLVSEVHAVAAAVGRTA